MRAGRRCAGAEPQSLANLHATTPSLSRPGTSPSGFGPRNDILLRAGETVRPSRNCTIRLIVLKDGGSAAARQSVLELFHRLGTTGEGIERFRLVALDVLPEADP